MTRVLLITHETSRTGAPRVADLAVRLLIERGFAVRVVARRDGPLFAEFAAAAPIRLEPLWRVRRRLWLLPGRVARILALGVDTALALLTVATSRCDLVYVNSTAAAVYIRPALWLRRGVVVHVHESREVFVPFLRRVRLRSLPAGVGVIACSPSVHRDLLCEGVPEAVVRLVPSVPDDVVVLARASDPPGNDPPDGRLVVGCVGSVEHRKGPDLWVAAARRIRAQLPGTELRFVWVGEGAPPEGIRPHEGIDFLGPSPNPYAYVRRFDVSTLPSRDDPFPLVVIEAMLLASPMVAFAVGSVPDQLGETGVLVAPGDVAAFADAVVGLLSAPDRRAELGGAARLRAQQEFSTQSFGDRLIAALKH